jgi:diguanylate cyclase (GGDEF)-like protein/PAS domain S-box-containing protein
VQPNGQRNANAATRPARTGRARRWLLAAVVALAIGPVHADEGDPGVDIGVAPHPLELRALVEPEAVLLQLTAEIGKAQAAHDDAELARLYLAQANACRVMADWACQRNAGADAGRVAARAKQPLQVVRGLIAEARGNIALQDFTRGEQLLGRAELLLKRTPSPTLSADVYLAYSSLSFQIGKQELSAQYADRGLAALAGTQALPMQVRLLRNKATAQSMLGDVRGARASLAMARSYADKVDDPKLSAEIMLVTARVARKTGDAATQVEMGRGVLRHATRLKNSQLAGLGHEVLGLAALDAGDAAGAEGELRTAHKLFRDLDLGRDELRVLRELVRLVLARHAYAEAAPLVQRFLVQEKAVDELERAQASDDFEARVKYAEREVELMRLEGEASMAREREQALARSNRLTSWLVVLGGVITLVLAAFFVQQRRSNARLTAALARLRESEAQGLDLLRLATGYVFLLDLDSRFTLVNPATAHALGHAADALVGRPFGEFLAEGATFWAEQVAHAREGEASEGLWRVRTVEGDRHWRIGLRHSSPREARAYLVANAADVTTQVQLADALREQSERDALTGCWNRRKLDTFEDAHARDGWAVLVIDLDHFKHINDTEGHERGDRVLVGVANFLHERVRAVDALLRIGGDEFALLLPGVDAGHVDALCARLRDDAAQAPCAFSLGVAVRDGAEPLGDTLARADAAMYAARSLERAAALGKRTEA